MSSSASRSRRLLNLYALFRSGWALSGSVSSLSLSEDESDESHELLDKLPEPLELLELRESSLLESLELESLLDSLDSLELDDDKRSESAIEES